MCAALYVVAVIILVDRIAPATIVLPFSSDSVCVGRRLLRRIEKFGICPPPPTFVTQKTSFDVGRLRDNSERSLKRKGARCERSHLLSAPIINLFLSVSLSTWLGSSLYFVRCRFYYPMRNCFCWLERDADAAALCLHFPPNQFLVAMSSTQNINIKS